ncbi:MAG: ABC transporter ATP-binding protein [Elusimicrobia bacterium]|nr:ABC transporter ATP-binding protein [Elusimicrobiota bacterium]
MIQEGEIISVIGPSGAGKSTLLHLIGLMDHPSDGTLELFGEPTANLSDATSSFWRNRWIGFLFQFHHLLPELSVWENVMLPLRIRGMDRRLAAERACEMLDTLGLAERLSHRPAELSGGEQQRVAFARALVPEPRLLLADEPTGNLDQRQGEELRRLLWNQARQRQMTVVLVTHQQPLAAAADRQWTLVDGQLQKEALSVGLE